MIYLASPYSHPDPAVREERYRAACQAAAALLLAGQPVCSPIVHSHPLVAYGVPTGWVFWSRFDRALLARCDEVLVLMLDGWQESVGVQAEIRIARALGKPVRYLAPELATGTPTLANVASGCPEADRTPTEADRPPTLAHVASACAGGSEVPG
jgi:nucleoside 2-deoxyribosyltransferase